MKTIEEIIEAAGDFVKSNTRIMNKKLEQDYLKKIGDASKVTATFSKHSSRVLPVSGEEFEVTMGKILKYLSDLSGGMAFSKDYDQLSYKPIRSSFLLYHESTSEKYTGGVGNLDHNNAILIYGIGGASAAATPKKKADFFRAYLIACDRNVDTATTVSTGYTGETENGHPVNYYPIQIQLGSTGSTARWTLYPSEITLGTIDISKFFIAAQVPKGSWANIQALRIPLYTSYANNQ